MPNRNGRARRHREENEKLRLVRKQIKRNREADPVRRRDWLSLAAGDTDERYDDVDTPTRQRVMPRGERERRRATLATVVLAAEEAEPAAPAEPAALPAEGRRGVVVEVSSGLCRVDLDGRTLICSLRGVLSATDSGLTNVVAVGDEVVVTDEGAGRAAVRAVCPRRSALVRPDVFYGHLLQVIVANVDQLLVVTSSREPPIWPELVDRYLIAAARNNLAVTICVNKIDLAGGAEACRKELRPYDDAGYALLFTSAATGEGVAALRALLVGSTTVLAGLSGVGKSSLLAAVQPGLRLRVGEVSDHWHLGRHTTSQVSLWRLDGGGYVVDTPGIREFGLSGLQRGELARFYPEMAALVRSCRFGDCLHAGEPGCAVVEAVQRGRVAALRYDSYRKILASLPPSPSTGS